MASAKRGRKAKPHRTSWGQTIDGLYRKPDGRWRIVATGYEFREADERIAVARFRQWQHEKGKGEIALPLLPQSTFDAMEKFERYSSAVVEISPADSDGQRTIEMKLPIPEDALWGWLREQLLKRPEIIADKVGIPQLANLVDLPLPRPSTPLSELIKAYKDHASVKDRTKQKAQTTWDELATSANAKTLRDLTTERLLNWGDDIKKRYKSADTVKTIFQRIKTVIAFGLTRGKDATEIRAALDRAKVLVSPKAKVRYKPGPISRQHFHMLLAKADDIERAILLFALNCCMYGSEALSANWDEIDFAAGTYLASEGRGKTNVIRAATLWPETIEALDRLPKASGAIFKSSRGDRYHPHSLGKLFRELRKRAGVPSSVKLNNLRDGAYTAACCPGVEFHLCQIVAGSKTAGESDHYIARNPSMVKPACDAIRRAYLEEKKVTAAA